VTGVGVGLGFLDMRVDLEDDPEDGGGGGGSSPSSPGRALVPLDDPSTPSALSSVNVTPKQGTSPATAQGAGKGGKGMRAMVQRAGSAVTWGSDFSDDSDDTLGSICSRCKLGLATGWRTGISADHSCFQ